MNVINDKDIIINRLRALINNITLMTDENEEKFINKANKMLDEYFSAGGRFIKIDLKKWMLP